MYGYTYQAAGFTRTTQQGRRNSSKSSELSKGGPGPREVRNSTQHVEPDGNPRLAKHTASGFTQKIDKEKIERSEEGKETKIALPIEPGQRIGETASREHKKRPKLERGNRVGAESTGGTTRGGGGSTKGKETKKQDKKNKGQRYLGLLILVRLNSCLNEAVVARERHPDERRLRQEVLQVQRAPEVNGAERGGSGLLPPSRHAERPRGFLRRSASFGYRQVSKCQLFTSLRALTNTEASLAYVPRSARKSTPQSVFAQQQHSHKTNNNNTPRGPRG